MPDYDENTKALIEGNVSQFTNIYIYIFVNLISYQLIEFNFYFYFYFFP